MTKSGQLIAMLSVLSLMVIGFVFYKDHLSAESRGRTAPEAGEIVMKVNKSGFHDVTGNRITELRLTRGEKYLLRFEYDEAQSDYVGDEQKEFKEFTHQFAIVSIPNTVFRRETGVLDYKNPTRIIEFMAGDGETDEYLVACLLYCLGMEHLANLHIKVVL